MPDHQTQEKKKKKRITEKARANKRIGNGEWIVYIRSEQESWAKCIFDEPVHQAYGWNR